MMKPTQNALRRVGYGVFSAMLTMGSASAGDSIVCIGDSLTSWGGGDISPSAAPANYMPDVLKGYSAKIHKPYGVYLAERVGPGFTVVNMSKAGGVTDSIMSWFGKKSLVTVSNLVFAAGQAKLDVAYSAKVVNWRCHNRDRCEFPDITVADRAAVERDFGGDASTGVNKLIGEMHGYGRMLLGEKGVTRIGDCSQPLTIPAGTLFTPDTSSLFRDSIHVIFTGTNDQANRLKDVADVVKDYVDTLPDARYVVITSHYAPNLSRHPEPYYRQLFGDHYIALLDEFKTNGVKRAIKLGLAAPSRADDEWISVLTLGRTNPHFNDTGCKVLADIVHEKLKALGYVRRPR